MLDEENYNALCGAFFAAIDKYRPSATDLIGAAGAVLSELYLNTPPKDRAALARQALSTFHAAFEALEREAVGHA